MTATTAKAAAENPMLVADDRIGAIVSSDRPTSPYPTGSGVSMGVSIAGSTVDESVSQGGSAAGFTTGSTIDESVSQGVGDGMYGPEGDSTGLGSTVLGLFSWALRFSGTAAETNEAATMRMESIRGVNYEGMTGVLYACGVCGLDSLANRDVACTTATLRHAALCFLEYDTTAI